MPSISPTCADWNERGVSAERSADGSIAPSDAVSTDHDDGREDPMPYVSKLAVLEARGEVLVRS
jgi:hypothetical protein